MAPKKILEALQAKPFEPIRICMADGQMFHLYHREMCRVGHRWVILGLPRQPTAVLYDRTIKLDPLPIIRLEPLADSSSKNGPQS